MKFAVKLVLFVLTMSTSNALATVLPLLPVRDNGIFGPASANNSNGGGQHYFVGGTRQDCGLVQFDLGSIPAGATINTATLTMYMDRASGGGSINIMLQKLNASWGEGTSGASGTDIGIRGGGGMGAAATTNDVTWNARFFNTTNWTTAGGDFAASPSATAAVGAGMSTNGTAPLQINWTGAGMVADINAWRADSSTNFGWLLKGTESSPDGDNPRRFMTVENYFNGSNPGMNYDSTGTLKTDGTLTPDFRPYLFIDYTAAPEPAGGAIIFGAMLIAGKRRR